MENYYIVFQCPKCGLSMTMIDTDAFTCKEGDTFALADIRASIQITNERGKMQLQEAGVIIYRLIPDLSFGREIVEQNSALEFERAPAECVSGVAEKRRIIIVSGDKKEKVEIFKGSEFSQKDFQKKMRGATSLLDKQ